MKTSIVLLAFFLFIFSPSFSQKTIEGVSNSIDINITKDPPVLLLVEGSLKFTDPNGNNAIDANEKATISFEVINKGKGDASDLKANLRETSNITGLGFDKTSNKGGLAPGAKKTIEIPVSGSMSLINGSANFFIKLDEESGFGLDEIQLDVKTLAFISPMVKVPDYTITSDMGTTLAKKRPFDLQILVQNVGKGAAENVKVNLSIPDNVLCISDNISTSFPKLISGETKTIVYSLIVNEKYSAPTIPITVRLNEQHDKFSENKNITLQLNQSMSTAKLIVESNFKEDNSVVKEASLSSDVDKNIPQAATSKSNTYAIIIGNEDYSSFQAGLSKEVNVDYAQNDAKIFKEYCNKTLGIPEKQIKLLINATSGQMSQGLAWINNLAKVDNGKAELVFYYSGHGLPDEFSKESYLIPVDVSGINVTQGIRLSDVYTKLTENPAQKVTVFLDACFSGGARNQSLVAMKSIKIKPKENMLSGNTVVFASSSGEESSGVYREKQHGYMTYYLLKKLQETKGEINYRQLADYITESVRKETALTGKIQTPQVNYSTSVENIWNGWKVK